MSRSSPQGGCRRMWFCRGAARAEEYYDDGESLFLPIGTWNEAMRRARWRNRRDRRTRRTAARAQQTQPTSLPGPVGEGEQEEQEEEEEVEETTAAAAAAAAAAAEESNYRRLLVDHPGMHLWIFRPDGRVLPAGEAAQRPDASADSDGGDEDGAVALSDSPETSEITPTRREYGSPRGVDSERVQAPAAAQPLAYLSSANCGVTHRTRPLSSSLTGPGLSDSPTRPSFGGEAATSRHEDGHSSLEASEIHLHSSSESSDLAGRGSAVIAADPPGVFVAPASPTASPPLRDHLPTHPGSHARVMSPGAYASNDGYGRSLSPSSPGLAETSFSSDKENRSRGNARSTRRVSGTKRTATAMADSTPGNDSQMSSGEEDENSDDRVRSNKRKRVGLVDRDTPQTQQLTSTQIVLNNTLEKVDDKRYYDPDQSMAERRRVRKGLRDLQKNLTDSRGEYLSAKSKGLRDTVKKANEIFVDVKQTSEATLDSRLLVQAGDLGAKRAEQVKLGDSVAGVNVDDFITKAISFMRRGPSEEQVQQVFPPDSTQHLAARSRRGRTERDRDSDVDEDGDDAEQLNWEWLGRAAAYPHNRRPGLPTFLLGPLSVQKKARKVTQRTQRQRLDPRDAIRPDEIELGRPGDGSESRNVTAMCRQIHELLGKTINEGSMACEAIMTERGEDSMTAEEIYDLMESYNLREDGGVCLFRFAFNPRSFGQTVENLFYICFLIRDGRAGISEDFRNMTSLHATNPSSASATADMPSNTNVSRNQGIFHLDHDIWRKLCDAYNVTECVIPHREPENPDQQQQVHGWYN